ncbi:CPBP family intramembrane glutamic endopeptidase [Cytobacillus massiliigabonensis]|uniref:CPBP family intramembrane glutamic endopeptidase n=1 Tax=Cytobacillus massiliigabonensis TaxID=1871011 RepID=UPI00115910FF|nr:CPBP family intramembrane glutamic endopeptidase [Cytobacillus massiliigabonensis]
MMISVKQNMILPYLQLLLFIIITVTVQYKHFIVAFALLLACILYLAIFAKQKRVFLWVLTAYIIGYLFFLFGDRLIDSLPYHVNILMVLSRCLMLFPILFMFYVAKKFSEKPIFYWECPNWQAKISFPFIWNGFHSISIKGFLLIAISVNIAIFMPFIVKANPSFSLPFLLFLFSFSIINGILEEILWRGIILTSMVNLAGEKAALLFSGLAFGLSHLILGYTIPICLSFAIGGIFYAGITIRSGSIFPAVIWHIVFNWLMILSGLIPFIN